MDPFQESKHKGGSCLSAEDGLVDSMPKVKIHGMVTIDGMAN